jgi:hypothetical protein
MENIMSFDSKDKTESKLILLGLATGAVAGLGVATILSDQLSTNLIIQKDPLIREAINNGVSEKQLTNAFQKVAPEIVNGEVKKLADLCAFNKDTLEQQGIDCSRVINSYKNLKHGAPPSPL